MKRKEKPLGLEEIKSRIIQANTPNWLHSEPHYSLFATNDGIKVLPLSLKAENEIFLLILLDLTHYSAEVILESLERIHQEYKSLPWKVVLVVEPKYLFMRDTHFFERFRTFKSFPTISLFLDTKGEWFEQFHAKEGKALIFRRGVEIFQTALQPNLSSQIVSIEQCLQDALRIEDPGLPLFPIRPHTLIRPSDSRIFAPQDLTTSGTWISTPSSIVSEDSSAQISFYFEGKRLRMIANSHPSSREPTRFVLTLNQEPVPSAHYGAHTKLGEKGSSVSEVGKTQGIFELLSASTPLHGEIRIRFLNAVENPIILYGFRAA